MGNICRGISSANERQMDAGSAFFTGPYNTGRGIPQVLFIGPEASGKTTLMYSTILPNWNNIKSEIVPTKTFHYEEFIRNNIRLGVWDISGSDTMQTMWPMFYRMIAYDVVIFVVSVLELDSTASKTWIRRLLNENELNSSTMIVVINTFSLPNQEVDMSYRKAASKLGLTELRRTIDQPKRFSWYRVNVTDGLTDPNWIKILEIISDIVENHTKKQDSNFVVPDTTNSLSATHLDNKKKAL